MKTIIVVLLSVMCLSCQSSMTSIPLSAYDVKHDRIDVVGDNYRVVEMPDAKQHTLNRVCLSVTEDRNVWIYTLGHCRERSD